MPSKPKPRHPKPRPPKPTPPTDLRRLTLASMPFTELEIPSLAAGTLHAFLARELPDRTIASRLPYTRFAERVGKTLYSLLSVDFMLGRAIFGMQLYPETKDAVRAYWRRKLPEYLDLLAPRNQTLAMDVMLDRDESAATPVGPERLADLFQGAPPTDDERQGGADGLLDYLDRTATAFIEEAAVDLAAETDAVLYVLGSAAANSYIEASLFPTLAVARELDRREPSVVQVLAGFGGMSYGLARPLRREYPFLDAVFEGEIEGQVLDWLQRDTDANEPPGPSRIAVNRLPTPDFSAYAAWADDSPLVLRWSIPIESARGCWWDRVERHDGDAFATCFFCNRHGATYREKDPERVASEMSEQAHRYGHSRFHFADSLVRQRNVEAVADAIEAQNLPFAFIQHARAQISPYEILRLWEAGMLSAQIGIEGLSTSFLRRIGKGTTTIQNLQAMKTFYELKITHVSSNLLIDFPGATEEEVDETAETIRRFAIAYQPLEISPFWLIRTTTVERQPEHFGIHRLRNRDGYSMFLPEAVRERLPLPLMDYDSVEPQVSWQPVREAVGAWERLHQDARRRVVGNDYHHVGLLYYRDHGVSLEIVDRRHPEISVYTLEPAWRDVYLYATEIRGRQQIERHFADRHAADLVAEILEQCTAADLMFRERDRYLSLATALHPHWAATRIREARDGAHGAAPTGPSET